MQTIYKQANLSIELSNWLAKNRTAVWQDLHQTTEKSLLKQQLYNEQNGICCYCCRCLQELDYHIEHLKCRDNHPEFTFDYQNLLISCNGNNSKHCGNYKDRSDLLSTPLDAECNSQLTLNLAGELVTDNADMQTSIDILNLNDKRLCEFRKTKIDEMTMMSVWENANPPLNIIDKQLLECVLISYGETAERFELEYIINKISA